MKDKLMQINWEVRVKNPLFWAQIVISILAPILAYAGLTAQDITSWAVLGDLVLQAIQNPYVLSLVVVSVWHTITDPTTKGVSDSNRAMGYKKPYDDAKEDEAQ